jgi:hypothetical protein
MHMHALVCIHPSTISSLGRVSFVFLFPSFYSFGCEDKTMPGHVPCLPISISYDRWDLGIGSIACDRCSRPQQPRARGSFSRCLSRHLPFGVHRRRYRGCGHWCKSPCLCGLRDCLHLAGYLSISPGLHLSKERSPGAHRRQADDRPQGGKREAGGRPWGSFVCLFCTDSASLVSYNSKPLPFRRTRAGMWPAIPCDESSGLAWGWSRSKAVIPFL